ncbi:MAG: hypothetical protein FJY77_01525 [Candidatus Altiarchaeales archaeon]|nr:hypothetical protein [Candidatus Altiarchaeales archaeon]
MDIFRFFRRQPKAGEPKKTVEPADAAKEADTGAGLSITPADVVDYIQANHTSVELGSKDRHSRHLLAEYTRVLIEEAVSSLQETVKCRAMQ